MALRRTTFLLTRLCFCVFILLTSIYCLLSYIPFTYHWLIKYPPVAWLPKFVIIHPYLGVLLVLALLPTMAGPYHRPETKRLVIGFAALCVCSSVWICFHPILQDVPNDYRAYIWSLCALFPMAWMAVIDLRTETPDSTDEERALPFSPLPSVYAGIFIAVLYAASSYIRFGIVQRQPFGRAEFDSVLWSVGAHCVVILSVFLLFEWMRMAAGRLLPRIDSTDLAVNLVSLALASVLLRKLVLANLGFRHWWADVYAFAISAVILLALNGLRRQLGRTHEPVGDASFSKFTAIGALLLTSAFAIFAPILIGQSDWNFLLKKLAAVAVWTAVLIIFYRIFKSSVDRPLVSHLLTLTLISLICFGGYKALAFAFVGPNADDRDLYTGYDTSFKLVRELLTPAVNSASYNSFYEFLQRNTTLRDSVTIQPQPVRLVEVLKPTSTPPPHIFFFVIDSLRSDYLSPYNHEIRFTPNFEAFSRESVVFQNAFTRYGGTVLSVPAMWTGSMQLHKQYIQPFYPMNELQQLVDTDAYRKWITMDPVIRMLMRPDPQIDELDRKAPYWTEYDLTTTLKEVENRLADHPADGPLFVYSQAHNLHTFTLYMHRKTRPPTKDYPGFYSPYASEVERMDAGFGEFISFLKQRGLYDNSIIIVTSDHGDSLGEFGRWGHSNTLVPEVIRIPLIIHLPGSLQQMYSDPQAVAFNMDITPTLFYLLGHRPIRNDEMLGRPLFTNTKSDHDSYIRNGYLLVSSYGPTYARLWDNGRRLFIVDAGAEENFLYDLGADPGGVHNRISVRDFPENERFIRQHVEDIARFYHYSAGLDAPSHGK